jgi:hypothetical protein
MMEELTHPVELTDEELELVCGGSSLVTIGSIDVDVVQANVNLVGSPNQQNF